jgi:hypothetical protein
MYDRGSDDGGGMMDLRRMRLVTFFCLVSAGILFSGTLTRDFRKTISFREGGNISLENTNGRAVVKGWNRDEVKIYAEIKVKSGDRREAERFMEQVKITIRERGDMLYIKPEYPRRRGIDNVFGWLFGKSINISINFDIRIPYRSNLALDLVNGSVEVADVEGEAELESTNGGIKAWGLRGSVEAHTTNGSVSIAMDKLDNRGSNRIRTTNGGIKLTLPKYVEADLQASVTNGRIHTDFEVEVRGKITKRRIRAEINGGGPLLDLHTVNGSISIYGD